MNPEHPEAEENRGEVDLRDVPDWHTEPGSGLWEFGRPLETVEVIPEKRKIEVDPGILAIRSKVEKHETPTFFSGPFANVERVTMTDKGVAIETAETDFFTYLASAYAHRDNVGANPIRPLAVQATIFSPDRSRMIIERRPESLADNPGKLSVFGGALKPGENPNEMIVAILNRKLGLDLQPEQVKASGLVRENMDNIYCLTYTVDLNEDQFISGRERATAANRTGERMFYQVSTDEARASVEQMFTGKRPVEEWDPNAFFNILYGLGAEGKRSPEELQALVTNMKEHLAQQPMTYTFPMEKYLSPDDRTV